MTGKKGLSGRKPAPKITAPEGRPVKADWLDPVGSEFWEATVVLLESMPGQLSLVDESLLNNYAYTASLIAICRDNIAAKGTTTISGNGSECSAPAVNQMLQLLKQMVTYERQLGLTPAARKALGMATKEKESNAFEAFLRNRVPVKTEAN